MMNRLDLVDASRNRQYLLGKTQHIIGGFGKGVGEPPGWYTLEEGHDFLEIPSLTGTCRSSTLLLWDGRPRVSGRRRAR